MIIGTGRPIGGDGMVEIKDHGVYELLEGQFERVELDYVILSAKEEYKGEESHKAAVIRAFGILKERFANFDYSIDIREDKMRAKAESVAELLKLPAEAERGDRIKKERNFSVSNPIPYWYAFLEPPHGTPYRISDFVAFHDMLIPSREDVDVYRWNDDFSNYFDAGKEWWGTGLWTVYDKKERVMIVIGASLTD